MLYGSHNIRCESNSMKLEIKKIGNSAGLILPKELMTRLGLEIGQELVVHEAPDGFAVTKGSADENEVVEEGLRIARRVMKEYHETLKRLAE